MSEQVTKRKTILQLLYRLLFLVVPTAFVVFKTLESFNLSYSEISTGLFWQAFYFG
jgi:hypothetical protein